MSASEEDELKKQFEQLQLQQQQKLLRRKELKQSKNQAKQDHSPTGKRETGDRSVPAQPISFGVEDNLNLRTEDPLPKSATYVSEELVEHLNEQIRELKDENGRLFKLLSERDFEIRQLRKRVEEDKIALAGSSVLSSDSAATKIVELSKKVRELNAALEAKRTEAKQLFGRCRHLENELAKTSNTTVSPRLNTVVSSEDAPSVSNNGSEAEIKQISEKLRQSEIRNAEYRNQVQEMKNELKMAQKVIANEVGEGVSVLDLINANSNWRGRAQQILALQKKIGEMKVQLEQQPQRTFRSLNGTQSPGEDLESEFMGSSQMKAVDMKHREAIRKLEKEKKEQLERSAAELKALEADYSSLKQKLEASKARSVVLTNENKTLKVEMKKLIDKGLHDDELISALITQQSSMKSMIEEMSRLQKENQSTQEERMSAIAARNQQENNIILQLKQIIKEKESKVKELENDLNTLKQTKIEQSQRSSVSKLFDRPSSVQNGEANNSLLETDLENTLPSTIEEMRLEEKPPSRASSRHGTKKFLESGSSSRPASRSHSASQKQSSDPLPYFRKSSARTGSANKNTSENVEEKIYQLSMECQEYKSFSQAAQVERDKLVELLKLMQQKLDESNQQCLNLQNEARTHKQNSVKFEKLIGKMKLEAPSSKSSSGQRKREKTGISMDGSTTDLKDLSLQENRISELETSLAIQKDENEALKVALETTINTKEEDLKAYNEMIEQTKLIFLQGLRQFKNKFNC